MPKLYSCYCHFSLRPGNFIDTKIKECINIPANVRGTFTDDAICVRKTVIIRDVDVENSVFQGGEVLGGIRRMFKWPISMLAKRLGSFTSSMSRRMASGPLQI